MNRFNIAVRGEFDVYTQKMARGANGIEYPVGEKRLRCSGKNLITNTGMDALASQAGSLTGWGRFLAVGTGNTPPANTDTALVAQVAVNDGASSTGQNNSWDGLDMVSTRIFTFATGVAAGTLAELGLRNSSSDPLLTRALFTDSEGAPTTVTVLSDEQLVVMYRLVWTISTVDSVLVTTTGTGTPVEYTVTARPASLGEGSVPAMGLGIKAGNAKYYHGVSSAIGAVTGVPTGTMVNTNTMATSVASYIPGSYYLENTATIPLTMANDVAIGALLFEGFPCFVQVGISPRITKTADETIRIKLRFSWSRG